MYYFDMDKKLNSYWPIYKNLEKEVLDLSYNIMFTDNQLVVYSVKIADLIFRCSAEIESLFKDIYRAETNREPETIGKCITYLEENWCISKKQIILACPNFYFKEQFKLFAPFNYENGDKNDYYSAYNAIKHDRVKNLPKANINILVRIMGALYLLNLYYKNEAFNIKSFLEKSGFDSSLGSSIFSVKYYAGNGAMPNSSEQDTRLPTEFQDCVYLTIYPQATYRNIAKTAMEVLQKQKDFMIGSKEFKEFSEAGNKFTSNDIFSAGNEIGAWHFCEKLKAAPNKREALIASQEYKFLRSLNPHLYPEDSITDENIDNVCKFTGGYYYSANINRLESQIGRLLFNSRMDIVLNKGQTLYPPEWRNS
jgi:hypothetical protein